MQLTKRFFYKYFSYLFFFPVLIIIRIIKPFILVRLDDSYSSRFGHFSGMTSLYLSKKQNKIDQPKQKFIDFFILNKKISNNQLYKIYKKKLNYLPWFFYYITDLNRKLPAATVHSIYFHKNEIQKKINFQHHDVDHLIDVTPPPINFDKEDIFIAEKEMSQLGLKKDDKIVMLIVRDSGYLSHEFPNKDWSYKKQDANIENFEAAINEAINRGYKVIRAGIYHKNFLQIKNPNYIDLFKINKRTSLLELYLFSICSFCLGTYSGGSVAANFLFRKPTIITNQIPLDETRTYSKNNFVIYKIIYDKIRKKKLNLSENFELANSKLGQEVLHAAPVEKGYADNNFFDLYQKKDFEIIENSSSEILSITEEVIDYLENNFTKINLYDKKFKNIFLTNLKNYPNSRHKHGKDIKCKIGHDFLNMYKDLIN